MTKDEKNKIISDRISSQKGMEELGEAMVKPITGLVWRCKICGSKDNVSCGIKRFPMCWRPEGTMVMKDEIEI